MTIRTQLSTMLPSPAHTRLLRACVHDGAAAREAWSRWTAGLAREGVPVRRALAEPAAALLPLLAWNFERNGMDHEAGTLRTHLRFALVTEELRREQYVSGCAEGLQTLRTAGIPLVVLKGAALGELVYPRPALRHSGDIDVLLRDADLPRAIAALMGRGWRRMDDPLMPSPVHPPPLVHPTGVPIELHRRLLIPYYTLPLDAMWRRSRAARVAGVDVSILSPADNLLHVVAHAMHGYGEPILRWVPDAWFILARSPDLSWEDFLDGAGAAHLGLPVHAALSYLAREIGAPIPSEVLAQLEIAAARAGFVARAAARLGSRRWEMGSPREVWAAPDNVGRRVARLWRRLFPPPLEFALRYDLRWWAVLFHYLARAARYARAPRPRERALPRQPPARGRIAGGDSCG
jgi:putative nucleotidyltransferase-like protein